MTPRFTHLDLFAGVGGFSRAVHWLGGITVAFVEWEAWNRRVLAKHWPHARFFGDIHDVGADELSRLGRIDLITGGYPCQPFSVAGQRRGHDDPRHLWPEMRRIIDTTRPRFVLAENVAGHITMGLDTVLAEMESDGYTAGAIVVPAGAVNALHRRDRVWIMAHTDAEREPQPQGPVCQERRRFGDGSASDSDTDTGQRDDSITALRTRRAAADGLRSGVADAAPRGLRRGRAPGHDGQPAQRSEGVGHADRSGLGEHGGAVAVPPQHAAAQHAGRDRAGSEAARAVDAGADGVPAGLVRRPAARSAWHDPDLIRAMWADGSWEADLPRVVAEEAERRQKLQAAGNAIVPIVAYEILRVMLGEAA